MERLHPLEVHLDAHSAVVIDLVNLYTDPYILPAVSPGRWE